MRNRSKFTISAFAYLNMGFAIANPHIDVAHGPLHPEVGCAEKAAASRLSLSDPLGKKNP